MIELKNKDDLFYAHQEIINLTDFKIKLFEACLKEVGLNQTFAYFEPSRIRIIGKFFNQKYYPTEKSEQLLMRNCVKRNKIIYKKVFNSFDLKKKNP